MSATLLVVDDDAMNRDALSRRITGAGYAVLVAESGPQALEIVRTQRVDLVLLDVMMPEMSGVETLRRLRQQRSVADLPVIMVTAKTGSEDVVEALEVGANDYITKPVDFSVAVARIRTQLTARRADPLTGLPNRVLFMDRLEQLLRRAKSSGHHAFAVFFLDIDRFKIINDSLGHVAGDELLVAVSRRLEQSLRASDTIARFDGDCTLARLGGDEFTILLDRVRTEADAKMVAERLLSAVTRPFDVQGRTVVVSISMGIVMAAARYELPEEMVRDADTAMYRAKALGKARCEVFDTSMLAAAEERLLVETGLRHALERGEFEVHYQPIVTLAEARLAGFEALLRWRHPTRGLLSPDQFIPTAEETGLIIPVGAWVLGEACRQMRAWDDEFPGCSDLVINVNLSAKQCLEPTLGDTVRRVLRETGLAPRRLKLEITESIVLEDSRIVLEVLNGLRDIGVQLGLDDFGMGYSALSYLQRLPLQTLKIDRSFVNGIRETGNMEIIRAIISMAAGLSMDVTAEGVETADQAAQLNGMACEFGQGFYFHRPMTADRARSVLSSVFSIVQS
jgi:diguanylate cyclase (GGDEF)-like protein